MYRRNNKCWENKFFFFNNNYFKEILLGTIDGLIFLYRIDINLRNKEGNEIILKNLISIPSNPPILYLEVIYFL